MWVRVVGQTGVDGGLRKDGLLVLYLPSIRGLEDDGGGCRWGLRDMAGWSRVRGAAPAQKEALLLVPSACLIMSSVSSL